MERLLVNYFHDFYIHGFTMAKQWGNQSIATRSSFAPLPVSQPPNTTGNPMTPSFWIDSPMDLTALASPSRRNVFNPPTQLCNWAIHVPFPTGDARCIFRDNDPQVQPPTTSFTEELRQSIACSSSNNTPLEDMPIAQESIVRTIENDPKALDVDAWKLAIVAGNHELLQDLFSENEMEALEGLDDIYPFHLAASFLDGGHACCKVFESLIDILEPTYPFFHNVDNLGNTILDALTVSILRSHTTISPDSVSYGFRSPKRFPGEEIDICGRWASDSPEVRELFGHGYCQIPALWKHPFCHSAVQAICHSIIAIYVPPCAPNINTRSGLFIRRCTECGLELRLMPLHTLVVTTYHLASSGRPGETLFGALAVLVCLLSLGADASLKANISVKEILMISDAGECSHADLSPLELMRRVPENIIDVWSSEQKVGWRCFAHILARVEGQRKPRPKSDSHNEVMNQPELSNHGSELEADVHPSDDECELYGGGSHISWMNLKWYGADIGLLWATIQTELLTYRRIEEGDPWMSERFSMKALEEWLLGYSVGFQTSLVTEKLMQKHSRCGWFLRMYDCIMTHPIAQEVSASYFMNMDIYKRTTYTSQIRLEEVWEQYEPLNGEEDD